MYSFNLETIAQTLQDTFNDILMPHLITFGVTSTSLKLKNISLALYPVPNTYPLDIDLSGGEYYPSFEQLGPTVLVCSIL